MLPDNTPRETQPLSVVVGGTASSRRLAISDTPTNSKLPSEVVNVSIAGSNCSRGTSPGGMSRGPMPWNSIVVTPVTTPMLFGANSYSGTRLEADIPRFQVLPLSWKVNAEESPMPTRANSICPACAADLIVSMAVNDSTNHIILDTLDSQSGELATSLWLPQGAELSGSTFKSVKTGFLLTTGRMVGAVAVDFCSSVFGIPR